MGSFVWNVHNSLACLVMEASEWSKALKWICCLLAAEWCVVYHHFSVDWAALSVFLQGLVVR